MRDFALNKNVNLGTKCFSSCVLLKNDRKLYYLKSVNSNEINQESHDKITNECLEVANSAKFKTNYEDVYSHLFGGNYNLTFLMKNDVIFGFAVFDCINIEDEKILHLHGIVMNPHVQNSGNTRSIILDKITQVKPDYLTLKTHNPRMYYVANSIVSDKGKVFPNFRDNIPNYIIELAKQNLFISNCNDNLVVENAYEDEKIQQTVNCDIITEGFKKIGKNDAQVVIVKLK